jgi:hypothetical protein
MPLIIDCYNVLHVAMPPMLAGLDEAGLCRAIDRTTWARSGVTLVADGRPKPLRAQVSPVQSVELIFAGSSRSADDVIIQHIRSSSAPRRLTVVSSDRQIATAAQRRRCRVWSSESFINRLCEQLRKSPGQNQPSDRPHVERLPPELVDRWLKAMGVEEP